MAAITRTIDFLGALGTERLELALLQHAQQLRLQAAAHRADLVEEDRAAVGQRELALLAGGGAGERAAHVAEQLRFEQRFGIAAQLTLISGISRCALW